MLFLPFIAITGAMLYSEGKPLVAVLEPEGAVITAREKSLASDLVTALLQVAGKYSLVSRQERDRLLSAHLYPPSKKFGIRDFPELARILYCDFIIYGSIESDNGGVIVRFSCFDTRNMMTIDSVEKGYLGFRDFISDASYFTDRFSGLIPRDAGRSAERMQDAIGPVPLRERMLFMMPSGNHGIDGAISRELLFRLIELSEESPRFVPLVMEYGALVEPLLRSNAIAEAASTGARFAVFAERGEKGFRLTVLDANGNEAVSVSLGDDFDPEVQSKKIAGALVSLPGLTPAELAQMIERNNSLEEKIGELLALKKTIARRFDLVIRGFVFKSAFAPFLKPLLNLLACDAGIGYYYDEHFGLGAGYGFSIEYPGTFDSSIEGHPRLYEHELRLVPFSYRTGGMVCFRASLIASLAFHDAYLIIPHSGSPPTYTDAGLMFYFKTGIEIGTSFMLSDNASLSVDWVAAYVAFPLVRHPQDFFPLSFSGDLLGLGIRFSF